VGRGVTSSRIISCEIRRGVFNPGSFDVEAFLKIK
jgi:hypothetical protein